MPLRSVPTSASEVRHVGGAASANLRDLLRFDADGIVLHAGSRAAYADLGDDGPGVVGVLAVGGVHLPLAVATALPILEGLRPGDRVRLRSGRLLLGDLAVSVTRLAPSLVPELTPRSQARDRLVALAPDLDEVTGQLPRAALGDLAAGDPRSVAALLGLGNGLTPVGDDVVAGWLVGARVTGRRERVPLAAQVRALAPIRTTRLSAALLGYACEGETIPQFRELLTALSRPEGSARDALADLLEVGHTSGAGMVAGLLLALGADPSVLARSPR